MKISFSQSLTLLWLAFLGTITLATTNPAFAENQPTKTNPKNMIHFMSFNLRCGTADDGLDSWPYRRQMVSDLIRREMPDFLGTQEMQGPQSEFLQKELPKYAVLQKERDAKPTARSEMSGLFYRKDRWTLDPKDQGTFWLSETPEVPGSMGPKAGCPRVVTWGRFFEKDPATKKETGRSIYVYNTHFDHRSDTARMQAAQLIAERMSKREQPEIPAVMMGDLNANEQSQPICYLLGKTTEKQPPLHLVDPFRMLHPAEKTVGTFTGFEFGKLDHAKIDYLFTTPDLKPLEAQILRDAKDGRYPSDHFPITLKVIFP